MNTLYAIRDKKTQQFLSFRTEYWNGQALHYLEEVSAPVIFYDPIILQWDLENVSPSNTKEPEIVKITYTIEPI